MEFYHLRSFSVVAQTGNLTLAAKQLCTTPPAVSAHIKALETELNTPLFIRSSKGMTLTEKGELLLVKAQKTLDAAIDMVNVASDNQHEVIGQFRLSLNQPPKYLSLSTLLDNLSEHCPGISTELHRYATGETIERIRSHNLDGGYIYGDIPDDFFALKVKSQAITTIAPYDCKLDQESSLSELAKVPWVTMTLHCPFDALLTQKLTNAVTAKVKTSDNSSRLELVQSGLGLSFVEKQQAIDSALNKKIKILPQLDTDTDLYFVVPKQRMNEPVIQAFLQEIRVLWQLPM